ncbi:MAG: nucleotidyltransferase domain-containing protein [Candidatus Cloacimonetes bacterium]|nr:nucleotidyltransferase domain-containing protein [Candidatus Cloacimonadota bacterium]
MKNIQITLPSTVRQFMDGLISHEKVEKIILFGSRAVKDNDERADVDIAVSGRRLIKRDIIRLRDKAYHARSLYWICLVHLESTPAPLKNRIIKQGVMLYEHT